MSQHQSESTEILTAASVLSETIRIIQDHVDEGAVEPKSRFVEDLALDSIEVMDIVDAFEMRFDISIPMNLLPEMLTVGDTADTLWKLVQERQGE